MKRKWTAEEWRLLERMRLAGYSGERIARELGRTRNAVNIAWSRRGPSTEYMKIQRYLSLVEHVISRTLKMANKNPEILDSNKDVV